MGKGRFFGRIAAPAAMILAVTWSLGGGCGISNDQGISFRGLGFFADGTGNEGDTGRFVDINTDDTVPNDTDGDGDLDGGFLGLQNNMIQGINVERVDLSYRVTGASISIPRDSFGLSTRLGPATGQEPANSSIKFSQIIIMGPQIFDFIAQNRNQFPDFPFTLIATAQAVGITDSGDEFRTNRVSYAVIVDDNPPPPEASPSATP